MVALERLLGAPCYHMYHCFVRDDAAKWLAVGRGDTNVIHEIVADCAAAVDWRASAYWEELAAATPDAVILLSPRDSEAWFKSATATIFPGINGAPAGAWRDMVLEMFANT